MDLRKLIVCEAIDTIEFFTKALRHFPDLSIEHIEMGLDQGLNGVTAISAKPRRCKFRAAHSTEPTFNFAEALLMIIERGN